MAQLETHQPSKTFRGTWAEVMAHSDEIPKTSKVELRVSEPRKQTATMALMQSWLEASAGPCGAEIEFAGDSYLQFTVSIQIVGGDIDIAVRGSGDEMLFPGRILIPGDLALVAGERRCRVCRRRSCPRPHTDTRPADGRSGVRETVRAAALHAVVLQSPQTRLRRAGIAAQL